MKRFKRAKDIRTAVIGFGMMGHAHVNDMLAAGMTPVAIVDALKPAREKARAAFPEKDYPSIKLYSSIDAMLKKSGADLVALVTAHNTHRKLGVGIMNRKRHLVVDKPMAITTEECDAMIASSKRNKVMLSIYHNRHWDGCVVTALKKLRSKPIGDIARVEAHMGGYGQPKEWWRTSKSIGGGILYDWGAHVVEWALQIIDSEAVEVTGFNHWGFWAKKSKYRKDAIEDEATAIVRFKNGVLLNFRITNIDADPRPGTIEIFGTKGMYKMGHGDWRMIRPRNDGSQLVSTGRNQKAEWIRFYRNVAAHLTKGTDLVITPQYARRPIHLMHLADRSAKQGKALKVTYR